MLGYYSNFVLLGLGGASLFFKVVLSELLDLFIYIVSGPDLCGDYFKGLGKHSFVPG